MDLLNNSSRYQQYLDRIKEYKEIADKNQAFSSIQIRVNALSQDLRSKNDKNYYNYLHLAIIGLGLMMGVISAIEGFYVLSLALIAGSLVSKYLFNHTLKSLIEDTEKEQILEQKEQKFDLQLFHRMQYLQNGIELKHSRITMVRYTFMAIFPLILVSSLAVFSLSTEVSWFMKTLLAAGMGCIFWFYFFKDDLDVLDFQEMELQEYLNDFMAGNPPSADRTDEIQHVTDLEEVETSNEEVIETTVEESDGTLGFSLET